MLVAASLLPLIPRPAWWIRIFDFPRVQLALLGLATMGTLAALSAYLGRLDGSSLLVVALLGGGVLLHVSRILPYTPLWPREVMDADPVDPSRRLRLLVSNVLMHNTDAARWLRAARAADADVIVAVETDARWAEDLAELRETHPHGIDVPQENAYGMCLFSRLEIGEVTVEHLVEPDVPSLFGSVRLRNGRSVQFGFLHPRPPRPDLMQDSHLRDAELVRAAHRLARMEPPVVIAGDLNDVAWSTTTRRFKRLSRLLDPRVGRGLYSTFHADHRWMRYPLDHVFHSDTLTLVELRRLPHVGSDHFPILIEMALDDHADQYAPQPDEEEVTAGAEAVLEARAFLEAESEEEREARREADV
jgi:endonuclease/exonuclease/phosphatase (EEP) superfamily protein YafD